MQKTSSKINALMIKAIAELRSIVNTLVNVEALQIVYAIQNIVYLKKFLWFFTMDQAMIITSS